MNFKYISKPYLNTKLSLIHHPTKIKIKSRKRTRHIYQCLSHRHKIFIEERCIKDVVQNLTEKIINLHIKNQVLLGLAGPPGSGKSTISSILSKQLNLIKKDDLYSIVVPMDGFHYYNHELDAMENPILAHSRRGAHWTFNSNKFFKYLKSLKELKEGSFPSFDHGHGDPVENEIKITKSNIIVIIEGNYLFLDIEPWNNIKKLFDIKWFVSCPVDICRERVYNRHISVGKDEETALRRINENDGPNAELIEKYIDDVDLIINSNIPLIL